MTGLLVLSLACLAAACDDDDQKPLPMADTGNDDMATGDGSIDDAEVSEDDANDTLDEDRTEPADIPVKVDQTPPEDMRPDLGPCDPTAIDEPDDDFFDANCDGIDGMKEGAIYVASYGVDDNEGSRGRPVRTLQKAIDLASLSGKDVYVNEGIYEGPIFLQPGVDIYGGYGFNWERNNLNDAVITSVYSASDANLYGGSPAILAIDLGDVATVLSHLEIEGGDALDPGSNAIAVYVTDSPGLRIQRSLIAAGTGAVGQSGLMGDPGDAGVAGNKGTNGCEHSDCDFCTCSECNRPAGGSGQVAASTCGAAPGGQGGVPGHDSAQINGGEGVAAQDGLPGSAGAAGGAGAEGNQGKGEDGEKGQTGMPGMAGMGGDGLGMLDGERWVGTPGTQGTQGSPGESGGGGGGGGGGVLVCDSYGGAGGAGGSGGCGGYGGYGGGGGGGSFGLFVIGLPPTVEFCDIQTAGGGTGGQGGPGGMGGAGGDGGAGGNREDDSGSGGKGGDGGNGGRGGPGGGGGGGISVGIYSATDPIGVTSTNNDFQIGDGGAGGFADGGAGEDGFSAETWDPMQ